MIASDVAERMCAACRQAAPRHSLIRLVCSPDGALVVDLRGRLPGRGAWVHPDASCVDRLDNRTALLTRTLSCSVAPGDVRPKIRVAVESSTLQGLTMAAAGGCLVAGFDQLREAMRQNRVVEWATASDASSRTLDGLRREANGLPCAALPWDKQTLGDALGQAPRAALGVLAGSASAHARRSLDRLRRLG